MASCGCFEWLRFAQRAPSSKRRVGPSSGKEEDSLRMEVRLLAARCEALAEDVVETKRRNSELESRVKALEDQLVAIQQPVLLGSWRNQGRTTPRDDADRQPRAVQSRLDLLRPPPLIPPKAWHLSGAEKGLSCSSDEGRADLSSCYSSDEGHGLVESRDVWEEHIAHAAAALNFELPFDSTVFAWFTNNLLDYTMSDAKDLVAEFCPRLSEEEVVALVRFFQDDDHSPSGVPDVKFCGSPDRHDSNGSNDSCGDCSSSSDGSSDSSDSSDSSSCSSPDSFDLFDSGKARRNPGNRCAMRGFHLTQVYQVGTRFPQIHGPNDDDDEDDASSVE